MTALAVIDAGNSTCTVGLFRDGELVARRSFSPRNAHSSGSSGFSGEIEAYLEVSSGSRPEVRLAGTDPRAVSLLEAALCSRFALQVAPRDFTAPILNLCRPAEGVGLDRLFCAAAVASRGRLPAVVVDAGTAITVDLVDREGCFLGGAIAPGLRISFEALHSQTGGLPLIEVQHAAEELQPLGTNTRAAILSGVVRGLAGLVDRLVDEIAEREPVRVVLTGGDAACLVNYLRCGFEVEPDLILHGLALGHG